MKKTNNILTFFAAILVMLTIYISAQGQTTTQVFKVKRSYDADSIATTTIKPVHDTVIIYPDTAAILALKSF